MNEDEKMDAIADIFEKDASALTPDLALDTLQWDSMAMLSVIALAKSVGKPVSGLVIRKMKTIADILAVL
ncbi:MAG: acyl carrier protein [Kiritimatiellia bacterium]